VAKEATVAALNDVSTAEVEAAATAALVAHHAPTVAELNTAVAPLAQEATIEALNDVSVAEVEVAAASALMGYDPPTKTELDAAVGPLAREASVASLNDVSSAEVENAAMTALTAYDIPTRAEVASDKAEIIAAIPESGDAPTAVEVADAVWDEMVADHPAVGSTGAALGAAGTSGDPWSTALPGAYSEGSAGSIIGNLDGAIEPLAREETLEAVADVADAIKSRTDRIGTASALVISPVGPEGVITLRQGDDYRASHGRSIPIPVADPDHKLQLDADGVVVRLKSTQAVWTATDITPTDDGYIVTFQPTAADTAALTITGQPYELEARLADGDVVTPAVGTLICERDIPAVT